MNGRSATQAPLAQEIKGHPGHPRTSICRTTLHFLPFISRPINLSCAPLHSPTPRSIRLPLPQLPVLNQIPIMFIPPQQGGPVKSPSDPLVLYSQSLRDYTLRLWMESRKQAEERLRARSHKKHHNSSKAFATSSCKVSAGGENVTSIPNEGSTLPS